MRLVLDLSDHEPDYVERLMKRIERLKHAHFTDIRARINGDYVWIEGDFIKHLRLEP